MKSQHVWVLLLWASLFCFHVAVYKNEQMKSCKRGQQFCVLCMFLLYTKLSFEEATTEFDYLLSRFFCIAPKIVPFRVRYEAMGGATALAEYVCSYLFIKSLGLLLSSPNSWILPSISFHPFFLPSHSCSCLRGQKGRWSDREGGCPCCFLTHPHRHLPTHTHTHSLISL